MGVFASFDGWIKEGTNGELLVALFKPASGACKECLRPKEGKFGLGVHDLQSPAACWDADDLAFMRQALAAMPK